MSPNLHPFPRFPDLQCGISKGQQMPIDSIDVIHILKGSLDGFVVILQDARHLKCPPSNAANVIICIPYVWQTFWVVSQYENNMNLCWHIWNINFQKFGLTKVDGNPNLPPRPGSGGIWTWHSGPFSCSLLQRDVVDSLVWNFKKFGVTEKLMPA